jgi:hypothetical protein
LRTTGFDLRHVKALPDKCQALLMGSTGVRALGVHQCSLVFR